MRAVGVRFGIAFGLVSLVGASASAGYDIRVNSVPGFVKDVHVVAIVPATCSATANCIAAEADLLRELQRYTGFSVIPADKVRQVMLETGMKTIDESTRNALAEQLHADAFLLPVIALSGTESQGGIGVWTGYTMMMIDSPVAKGSVQIALIDAKSGHPLMEGAGFGESEWRSKKGVLRKIFQSILSKAFGPPDK